VASQKSVTYNKRRSSDVRAPACRALTDAKPVAETRAPYRCVFLTEAQSSSVGQLSSKRRDTLDMHDTARSRPQLPCSTDGARLHAGTIYCHRLPHARLLMVNDARLLMSSMV